MFISFITLIISLFSLLSNLFADTQTEYPKLYQSLWPEFCENHLLNEKEACSEQLNNAKINCYFEYVSDGIKRTILSQRFCPYKFYTSLNPEFPYESIDMLVFIPEQEKYCSYLFCKTCNQPVKKSLGVLDRFFGDQQLMIQYICECNCIEKSPEFQDYEIFENSNWCGCKNLSIPFAYFNTFTAKYFQFFNHHLLYSKQNPSCTCYWPYVSKIACKISNIVYDEMESFFRTSCLFKLVYKEGKPLPGNVYPWGDPILLKYSWCSEEGENEFILRTLQNYFIFTFFYSNYQSVIIDLCKYIDINGNSKDLDNFYSVLASIRPLFLNLYSNCLDNHPHPKIYYERGMCYFHEGDLYASLTDMKAFINSADSEELETLLTSDFYLQEGTSYAELGQYDEAIEALTKSIAKDPQNKESYFERASVYFETGDFDLAIQDYLASDMRPTPLDPNDLISIEFSKYLMSGILKGTGEAALDFVPSILSSINGLSHALWAFGCDPLNCSKEMVATCKEMIELLSQKSSMEILEAFIPEVRDFNNSTSNEEKAKLLGYMIGKYGTEMFAPLGIIKTYKKLKTANKLLTLEHLAQESKQATVIKSAAGNWKQTHVESIEKFRRSEKSLKTYKSQSLHENQVRKILHQAGFTTFPRPKGIPENFKVTFSDRGCGMKYINPNNTGTYVRVMPGKPHSMLLYQQKPYVIQLKDGKTLDKFGNIVPEKSIEAHISLDEFIYHHD